MSLSEKPAETPERQAYYGRIDKRNLTPLWSVLNNVITPEPRSGCQPCLWNFAEAKSFLLEAGGLITAKEAERRVLVLESGYARHTSSG